MNLLYSTGRLSSRVKPLFFVLSALLFFPCRAYVTIETDTLSVNGKKVIVRASSRLQDNGRFFSLRNLFDNDSCTCWIEGVVDERAGRWIEVRYQEKKRIKGLVFGAGCRKEILCLRDFSAPASWRIKLDEKPPFDYAMDWDVSEGILSGRQVNMRKALVWFDTDTAFTTASVQMKFLVVVNGRRYLNLSLSDFEPVETGDGRFELLDIISSRTYNPNDIGAVNVPVLGLGADGPGRAAQVIDSIYKSETSNGRQQDSALMDRALNTGMGAISDKAEIARLVPVLKRLLVTGGRMTRFCADGRSMVYMQQAMVISFGRTKWDVWRFITTRRTSLGLELTVRYVPFLM
jgi:hypothetical protein